MKGHLHVMMRTGFETHMKFVETRHCNSRHHVFKCPSPTCLPPAYSEVFFKWGGGGGG